MNKKYLVRLTAKERRTLCEIVKKLKGSSQKVRRAQMLLKADVAGPAWTDQQIAEVALLELPADGHVAVITSATPIALSAGVALDLGPGRVMQ